MNMKKRITAFISLAVVLAILITGTFAWINIAQSMTNEWEGGGKPGGTTHDDFCKPKKDVYIENWGTVPLFVRIRLDEYMEIGEGAALKGDYDNNGLWLGTHNADNKSVSLMSNANIDEKDTWQPHIPVTGDVTTCDPSDPGFHDYWKWSMGGWKYYEKAPSPAKETIPGYVHQNTNDYNGTGPNIGKTLNATVLTMAQWIALGEPVGEYWVIDVDGWAYWAAPLMPGQATGLLLNKVELINDPEDSYYYAINVLAQMATKSKGSDPNDPNYGNYEDFYNEFDDDHTATQDGKDLLDKIVNITGGGSGSGSGGINSNGGTMIGDKLFLKQGATANLSAKPSVFNSDDINWSRTPVSTTNFTFNSHGNGASVTASLSAAIGSKLEVTATSVQSPSKTAKITVIVITKDAAGVVLGGDGNLYLDWGDNTFTQIDEDGNEIGDMLCGGMDEKPGTSDDRFDIVTTENGTKLLGPNPDGSYQSAGPDGKLGTDDDLYWWIIEEKKDENVEDLTFPQDFTQEPPETLTVRSVKISPPNGSLTKGKSMTFTAVVKMSDNSIDTTGVTWSVIPGNQATIDVNGVLTINSNASVTSVSVTATSKKNPAVSSLPVTVTIKPDIEDLPTGATGRELETDKTGDTAKWIEIATNGNYSLIVRTEYIPWHTTSPDDENFVWTIFGTGAYNTSNCKVREIINNWFTGNNSPVAKLAANAPLRNFTVKNTALNNLGSVNQENSLTAGFSSPVATPDGTGNDVAFALSFIELVNFCSKTYLTYNEGNKTSTGVAPTNFDKISIPFPSTYGIWTRSPGSSGRSGAILKGGYAYQVYNTDGYNMVYPALWVDSSIFD